MQTTKPLLSEGQKQALRDVHEKMQGFFKENDNEFTYALTGLISQLCAPVVGEYCDMSYIEQKVRLIAPHIRTINEASR